MLLPNNRTTLLIDGIGATISALSLGGVLVYFQEYFGMPIFELRVLGSVALCFAVYSVSTYFWSGEYWRIFLRIIAICNLLYCVASILLLTVHANELTLLGWLYFVPEILLVGTLAIMEWRISSLKDISLSKP